MTVPRKAAPRAARDRRRAGRRGADQPARRRRGRAGRARSTGSAATETGGALAPDEPDEARRGAARPSPRPARRRRRPPPSESTAPRSRAAAHRRGDPGIRRAASGHGRHDAAHGDRRGAAAARRLSAADALGGGGSVAPIERYLATLDHEDLLVRRGRRSGVFCIVAVHSTARGPALGGCRMWRYDDSRAALRDALRLSRAMTYKTAVAGLPLGGGKGVIMLRGEPSPDARREDVAARLRRHGRRRSTAPT